MIDPRNSLFPDSPLKSHRRPSVSTRVLFNTRCVHTHAHTQTGHTSLTRNSHLLYPQFRLHQRTVDTQYCYRILQAIDPPRQSAQHSIVEAPTPFPFGSKETKQLSQLISRNHASTATQHFVLAFTHARSSALTNIYLEMNIGGVAGNSDRAGAKLHIAVRTKRIRGFVDWE